MSESDENQENILKWTIRYVLIPITLAAVGGWIALEVVNREIASRTPAERDVAAAVFATMTAAAPNNQPTAKPTATATIEPTPTQEAADNEPGDPSVAKPPNQPPAPPPVVCGQVPAGWQLYTVQPGNTLYSLARNSGTSIAAIRQVNCLYGQLLAYQLIWLPEFYHEQPEPTVEVTQIVEPVITATPTATASPTPTEPAGLPDLISDAPTIRVSCPEGCVTTVILAITNVGSAAAGTFNVQVQLDPAQSVVLNQSVEFLEPGETAVLTLVSPPGGNCYDPNCSVRITVDSRNGVVEENEANNLFEITIPG